MHYKCICEPCMLETTKKATYRHMKHPCVVLHDPIVCLDPVLENTALIIFSGLHQLQIL